MARVEYTDQVEKMPLTRTLRSRSASVAITIPKPIAQSLDWEPGTSVEIEVVGRDSWSSNPAGPGRPRHRPEPGLSPCCEAMTALYPSL